MKPCKEPISMPKWYGYALQALAILSIQEGVCASASLADRMESRAPLLRRIMTLLVKDGLVVAKEGRDGGYRLGKPPEQITFADVYRAMNMQDPFSQGITESAQAECLFGQEVQSVFGELAIEMEERIIAGLEKHTIAELRTRVHEAYLIRNS